MTSQRMETQPWQSQILGDAGAIEYRQDPVDSSHLVLAKAPGLTPSKEALQPLVSKSPNHLQVSFDKYHLSTGGDHSNSHSRRAVSCSGSDGQI